MWYVVASLGHHGGDQDVVGLGFGAFGLAFGVLTALASLVAVVAPFALIGWLLWRLFRQRPAAMAGRP